MKKIKIILSVVLILAMSMMLFACGDGENESSSSVPIPADIEVRGDVEGESTLPKTLAEAVERINAAGYNNEVLNSEYNDQQTGMLGMAVYYDATNTNYMEVRFFSDTTNAMTGYIQRLSQKTDDRAEVLEIHGCWVIVATEEAIEAFVG